jgi:Icc-related predicted phosphoesterase
MCGRVEEGCRGLPGKFTRVFFATDIHGSERCFRKFLGAPKFYKADVLVLGGDITGKLVIPIVDHGKGSFRADYLGKEEVAKTPDELKRLEQLIADSGYYYHYCNKSEMDELRASKEKIDSLFVKVMKETLVRWMQYAEDALKETGTVCYVTGGNDDMQEIIDEIRETEHVKNPDNRLVRIDPIHEMVSMGWSNPTPWKCPRECSDDKLGERIEKVISSVADPANCVYNFHTPPKDCGLDTVPKLDDSVYPPKPIVQGGQQVMFGAGSESVKRAVEKNQPLVDLCGHVHESRGVCKIGRTFVVNPGSEYTEGILRGAIVNLSDKKVLSWQLTSG